MAFIIKIYSIITLSPKSISQNEVRQVSEYETIEILFKMKRHGLFLAAKRCS